jgi:effector-binding domain-containing protein
VAYAIEIVDAVSRPIAVARGRVALGRVGEAFMPLMDRVWAVVRALGVEPIGHNVAIYRLRDNGLDLEIGVQVAGPFEAVDGVEPSQTPSGPCARTLHTGPYSGIRQATDAVIAWGRETGRSFTGVSWEVYGDWNDDESKLQTWIHFQLA